MKNLKLTENKPSHKGLTLIKIKCIVIIFIGLSLGCKKFVEPPAPVTSVTDASVYNSDAAATAVLTGIYAQMSDISYYSPSSIPSLSVYAGLSADELVLWSGVTNEAAPLFYTNQLSKQKAGFQFWNFTTIYTCNAAIEGISASNSLSKDVKNQLLGEAHFVRALNLFYLMNLYGDIPLPLSTNYELNSKISRTSQVNVLKQIVVDLSEAKQLLSTSFLDGSLGKTTLDRVRPTKWAASALLARAYLYAENWTLAEQEATSVISNTSNFSLVDLQSAFLKNNKESIWQLYPVNTFPSNTWDGLIFNIPQNGPSDGYLGNPVYLSTSLLSSFEKKDQRRIVWIDSVSANGEIYYYPAKYKMTSSATSITEYTTILRLAEQYLIRAECRAHQNNVAGAQDDINKIRTRAGLENTSAASTGDLLREIFQERRVELFSELGHRWFDLKRFGALSSVMKAEAVRKKSVWQDFQQLYPIPIEDINRDPNLKQNPGY